MEILEELQFIGMVLRVKRLTKNKSLRSETGLLSMRLRIKVEKVMFIHHLKTTENTTLAKVIYNEEVENGWPGLDNEVKIICEKLSVEDVNATDVCKASYR